MEGEEGVRRRAQPASPASRHPATTTTQELWLLRSQSVRTVVRSTDGRKEPMHPAHPVNQSISHQPSSKEEEGEEKGVTYRRKTVA